MKKETVTVTNVINLAAKTRKLRNFAPGGSVTRRSWASSERLTERSYTMKNQRTILIKRLSFAPVNDTGHNNYHAIDYVLFVWKPGFWIQPARLITIFRVMTPI